MRRHIGVLGIALLGASSGLASAAPGPARFYTVQPCRAVDTRLDPGPMGGPALVANQARTFALAGACGTPPTAAAVSANVTIVSPSADGSLQILAAGSPSTLSSTLSYRAGFVRANNSLLGLSPAGVSVLCTQASGGAHLLIDISGYFDDPAHNQPPQVNAGSPQTITLPAAAHLSGTATDDGLPAGSTLTFAWTSLSGPGAPVFTAPAALATDASFPAPGIYVLRLAASDGQLTGTATVTITVQPAAAPTTLFLASLAPQGISVSSGAGTSTLRLASDERSCIVTLAYGNLTTPVTGAHIHGPADPGQSGPILFDLDTSPRQPDGSWLWTFVPVGTTTVAQIVDALKNGRLYVNVHTSRYPAGEIRGQYGASSGTPIFVPPPPPPPLPPGPPTAPDAARFLTQATWGPTTSEITRVTTIGFDAWIAQQIATPAASHLGYLDAAAAAGEQLDENQTMEAIWTQALAGPDQLRARVAMALTEILVISDTSNAIAYEPEALSGYMDILNRDAFATYRTLLEDVTKSPTMGAYLNMLGNDREDPASGQKPNENYAREILQLFSVGLYQLHPDGRLKLGADGLPIPTYGQDSVEGLAHVFTGWNFGGNTLDDNGWYGPTTHWRIPMEAWPDHHSTGAKSFLGITVPANGTPQQDLTAALDAIAAHPNTGPFVCRQLIQRLVTSNPSPAYVYRCGQVFADDGHGVRGNLGAVVKAILTDWEARAVEVLSMQGYGKQREPMLKYGALLRAFHATALSGKFRIWYLEDEIYGLGQNPLRAPSVFNFFPPDWAPPGEVSAAGLVAPEFKLTTETQVIGSTNYLRGTALTTAGGSPDDLVPNLAPWLPLAATPQTLVDQLDLLLTSGQMPADAKTAIVGALNALTDPTDRVQAAMILFLSSPEFAIQR